MTESAATQGRSNQRAYPRYMMDVRVTVQAFRNGQNLGLWGRSTEMGADGVGVTLTGELEPGEVVTLEFQPPAAHSAIKLRAIVRYRQGLRHGFEFLALSGEQRASIQRSCQFLSAHT